MDRGVKDVIPMRLLQLAALASLLGLATLCGFCCWGVAQVVESERHIATDTDATVQMATLTSAQIGEAAANVNGLVRQVRVELPDTFRRVNSGLDQLDQASAGLNAAVAEINRPCKDGDCGTVADANRAINSIRLAAGQVTAISEKEQSQRVLMNAQEQQLALDTHDDLTKLGTAIDGVNALATNKDLTGSLEHTNTALGAVAGMATDTQKAWHDTLHPKWPKRVWNFVTGVGLDVAKVLIP